MKRKLDGEGVYDIALVATLMLVLFLLTANA